VIVAAGRAHMRTYAGIRELHAGETMHVHGFPAWITS
jgi:hypothetical protein